MRRIKWHKKAIADWHKKTFPDCTTDEQRYKCRLEAREYFKASNFEERMSELADCYIANAALGERFHDCMGRLFCRMLEDSVWWDELQIYIHEKMEINSKRSWHKFKREWRHVEGRNNG